MQLCWRFHHEWNIIEPPQNTEATGFTSAPAVNFLTKLTVAKCFARTAPTASCTQAIPWAMAAMLFCLEGVWKCASWSEQCPALAEALDSTSCLCVRTFRSRRFSINWLARNEQGISESQSKHLSSALAVEDQPSDSRANYAMPSYAKPCEICACPGWRWPDRCIWRLSQAGTQDILWLESAATPRALRATAIQTKQCHRRYRIAFLLHSPST